jgi:hypothetical protein
MAGRIDCAAGDKQTRRKPAHVAKAHFFVWAKDGKKLGLLKTGGESFKANREGTWLRVPPPYCVSPLPWRDTLVDGRALVALEKASLVPVGLWRDGSDVVNKEREGPRNTGRCLVSALARRTEDRHSGMAEREERGEGRGSIARRNASRATSRYGVSIVQLVASLPAYLPLFHGSTLLVEEKRCEGNAAGPWSHPPSPWRTRNLAASLSAGIMPLSEQEIACKVAKLRSGPQKPPLRGKRRGDETRRRGERRDESQRGNQRRKGTLSPISGHLHLW